MTALLDVNVLIALAWPNHVHHVAARSWFDARRNDGWATCAFTEAGFVRVSCNPAAVRHTVTPLDAIELLGRLTRLPSHAFWPLDWSIEELPATIANRLQGYRQVTDAMLLATAIRQGGRLTTLDSGIAALASADERSFLCVIPV